jgi:hypothetical protein
MMQWFLHNLNSIGNANGTLAPRIPPICVAIIIMSRRKRKLMSNVEPGGFCRR